MIDPGNANYANEPGSPDAPEFAYAPTDREPAVSIVTPYFNARPDEFDRTARCVMRQSLAHFEWLIVNDGSTDEAALKNLERWRKADPRVRVIDVEHNAGPSAARNRGYQEARCEHVFQLDADDLIEPTTIEKCLWHARTHPNAHFVNTWEVGFGASEYLWRRGFHESPRFLEQCLVGAHMVLVRKQTHAEVGGYDETIRGGMEDWEFWLRCADHGYWGATLPEFLSWYRRRDNHADAWENWDGGDRQRAFREGLRRRYDRLYTEGMPRPQPRIAPRMVRLPEQTPIRNTLDKSRRRLLMIVPWMRMGGADKFNLDLVEQLTGRGWEVTIASTLPGSDAWLPAFARFTPDIFPLPSFCHPADYPLAMRYLIESRQPDTVMVTNSDAGYQFLPYLRSVCPDPAYVDYNHMEEIYWREGGHPRTGAAMSSQLDLCITASKHVREWMIERGAQPDRVEVATINVEPRTWNPDPEARAAARERLEIDDDTPVILYAGRICDQKQPDVFALSMRELATRAAFAGREFVCLVAGDGELRPELEEDLDRYELRGHVRMLGEVSSELMVELMAASDIFFLPSRWEGIALVFYEAMASGVVVVGADVGGQKELVTPECGVLLPKAQRGRERDDEPGPYAEVLLRLISNTDERRAMAEAARRRICESFTLEQMGDRMESLLEHAIELHRDEPRAALAPEFAMETALRAIDLIRMSSHSDRLWKEIERLREDRPTDPKRRQGQARQEPRENMARRAHAKARRQRRRAARRRRETRARRELRAIEASRSWRVVSALKNNPLYAMYARVRWGSAWREQLDDAPASERLERIVHSRAFRLIQLVKRLRPARREPARNEPIKELKPVTRPRIASEPHANGRLNGHANGSLNGHATRTVNPDRSPTGEPARPD